MNSSGSHDDPEGAQSVPLVNSEESLRKNYGSGSNAPQKRIHGHDGEQQQKNDSVESQIHRRELTPEFDASPFSIEKDLSLEYWQSKVQNLDSTSQTRNLKHFLQSILEVDDYGDQRGMAAAGGAAQTNNMHKVQIYSTYLL
ncbi:uncharacterized protein LOC121412736 [Lytechinus variegatus]|uniref:uncharacterized protein LOC121412736 n=1 Tax=Lytechinus variegatus TaxID=7654 RepID=UPI001BB245BA|nr:uncharacterized protein LOC121412736 [Lytechinus variegatus]